MNHIELQQSDGVALLRLNRPDQRNMLSAPMCQEMIEAVQEVESNTDINALLITGNGKAFCAGADLNDLLAAGKGEGAGLKTIYSGFLAIANCALPTVAAVNGPAVGAGMNLALACDIRMVSTSASFDTRFLQLGIHPGGGHTWMLQREVNWQMSTAAVLFGHPLRGEEAVKAGMALTVHNDEDLLRESVEFAKQATRHPRELLINTKKSLRQTRHLKTQEEALELEYLAQILSLQEPEAKAGLQKMLERIGRSHS